MLIGVTVPLAAALVIAAATGAGGPPPAPLPPGGDIWSQVSCEQTRAGCDLGVGTEPGAGGVGAQRRTEVLPVISPRPGGPVCTTTAEISPEVRANWIARGELQPGQRFVLRTCTPGGREWLVLNPGDPVAAGVALSNPAELAATARDRLVLPRVVVDMSPVGSQLVGLPTWLWIDRAGWGPVTRSVSVPGAGVTATASPVSVSWSTGDGQTVDCPGPGTPYSPLVPPSSVSPDCGHTYAVVSPAGGFRVSATVRWSVSWSGAAQTGVFPGLVSTASLVVDVVDAPAVNVTPGGAR